MRTGYPNNVVRTNGNAQFIPQARFLGLVAVKALVRSARAKLVCLVGTVGAINRNSAIVANIIFFSAFPINL